MTFGTGTFVETPPAFVDLSVPVPTPLLIRVQQKNDLPRGVNPPFLQTLQCKVFIEPYGSVSKPCTPGEHQNSW